MEDSNTALESSGDISKISENLLRGAKAWGVFPTPVEKIVTYAELCVADSIDLSAVEPGFLEKFGFIPKVLDKLLGMIDFRQRTIYIDQSMKASRQNFVKLHEVFHGVLPWQSDVLGRADDAKTLDPDVEQLFEREANFGASSALFQLDIFDDKAKKLPLSIKSAQHLAKEFGGSIHAALRRYVLNSPKRCCLLVFHPRSQWTSENQGLRNCFLSKRFENEIGQIGLDAIAKPDTPFIRDIIFGKRWSDRGKAVLQVESGESVSFDYHFFNSTYNSFVLLMPQGEKNKSRITLAYRNARSAA